jgi:hypothetical protein
MTLVQAPLSISAILSESSLARKRTSSFSYPTTNPRPAKAPRTTAMGYTGSLQRTESVVILPDSHNDIFTNNNATTDLPFYRTLQYYKEQRLRRKAQNRATLEPISIHTMTTTTVGCQPAQSARPAVNIPHSPRPRNATLSIVTRRNPTPLKAPPQVILPSVSSPITTVRTPRTSSPLSPSRTVLPGRPVFPKSKPEPDLYRTAIKMRMQSTPEGQKILHMGPRLALSIMSATQELERLVADQRCQDFQRDEDNDVIMSDSTFMPHSSLAVPVLPASWVMVKGEDLEMVDCAA